MTTPKAVAMPINRKFLFRLRMRPPLRFSFENPTPECSFRRFFAGDLDIKFPFSETVHLIRSQVDDTAHRAFGCFRDGEVLKRRTAHAGREPFMELCSSCRARYALERCIEREFRTDQRRGTAARARYCRAHRAIQGNWCDANLEFFFSLSSGGDVD